MDFASESVRDAFPLPQSRPAQANAALPDDNGRSFDEHLDSVNDDLRERTAPPQNEARDEIDAPVEALAARSEDTSAEEIDVDAALLGGPLPTAPPPMAAPVLIQIAAATQAEQTPDVLSQDGDAPSAPMSAPQPASRANEAETAAAQPVAPGAPEQGKSSDVDVKDATPKTAQTDSAPQAQTPQPNSDAPSSAAQQTASAPVASELPQAVQQAIATTIAATPQLTTQPTTRSTKDTAQAIEAKAAPETRDGKAEAPISSAKAQANAAKNVEGGKVSVDALPAPAPQSTAPDVSQIAENSAISATASQASTHVQQASAETGAQRAAPAAQVGREIIRRFNGGTTNFELRLDPADLGRVEVRMEVTRDNRVTAVITADNPQALTELARGARELEQQLESAGLQLTENGLSFDLRQGAQGRGDSDETSAGRGAGEVAASEQQAAPVARPIGYERWRGVRVDMMV